MISFFFFLFIFLYVTDKWVPYTYFYTDCSSRPCTKVLSLFNFHTFSITPFSYLRQLSLFTVLHLSLCQGFDAASLLSLLHSLLPSLRTLIDNANMDRFDFISSLPDAILLLFLMLLETKEAVRTCVLSKRWERLWISLPFLNITCHSLEGMSHSLSLLTNAERLELCVTCPQLQVCNL